jgi:hypothetical protein
LQWNRIARTVSAASGLNQWENAQLFVLLNMALADSGVGTAETKYPYNYWRPQTAIQFAASDGNPDTIADPDWEPLDPTPPLPGLRLRPQCRRGRGGRSPAARVRDRPD